MSKRTADMLIWTTTGALLGLYAAFGYEWLVDRFGSEWPTRSMFLMTATGGMTAFLIIWAFTPTERERMLDLRSRVIPICNQNHDARDIVIDKVYSGSIKADLIKERMHYIRMGWHKPKPGENYGDTFKGLVEGSDPLDT